MKKIVLSDSKFNILTWLLICLICCMPLFLTLQFRHGLFLTWEGSYRISLGQLPFIDFGVPFGVGAWLIPGFFMKIFGPEFSSLIYSQSFINLVFFLVFISTLRSLNVKEPVIYLSVLVLCLSYVIKNYWPYYNNTVIFYQFISHYFLIKFLYRKTDKFVYGLIVGVAFFGGLSFFTKQDIGATGLLISIILLLVDALYSKRYKYFLVFLSNVMIVGLVNVWPFLNHSFNYWFNYGQSPHHARLSMNDFLIDIFDGSEWLKLYVIVVVFILWQKYNTIKEFINDRAFVLKTLFLLGIILQASIIQVTSYEPETTHWYFHSIAVAFILSEVKIKFNYYLAPNFILISTLFLLWWSPFIWYYAKRYVIQNRTSTERNFVSKHTRAVPIEGLKKESERIVKSSIHTLNNIKLPLRTEEGLNNLINSINKRYGNDEISVLNMSELTFLVNELNYKLPTGSTHPLWYHVGVCFFEREYEHFAIKIQSNAYDVIFFQEMDIAKDFFPNQLHSLIKQNDSYELFDEISGLFGTQFNRVQVYVKKKEHNSGLPQPVFKF